MNLKNLAIGFLSAAAILSSAPVASAEYFVPPGNSAATQYTQTLPSAGGGDSTNGGAGKTDAKPGKTLGQRNTAKLNEQGKTGREVAEVVAATAPPTAVDHISKVDSKGSKTGHGGSKQHHRHPGGGKPAGTGQGNEPTAATRQPASANPEGDSALGQLVGKVTGLSTSGSSILLPALLLAAIAWAVLYGLTRRRRPAV